MTLILYFLFVIALSIILLLLNAVLATHKPDLEKISAYECGFSPIYGQTRSPFSISFYLVGILFLLFDLEILLVFPLSTILYSVGDLGLWTTIYFFLVLLIGFVYEWQKKALKFN